MIFVIPSCGRAKNQLTLRYLNSIGYGKDQILVQVQSKSDLFDYTESIGVNATVLMADADRLSVNANNALKALPDSQLVVIMDDDIKSPMRLIRGTTRLEVPDRNQFDASIRSLTDAMSELGARVGTCYASANGLSMGSIAKRHEFSRNRLGSGWLIVGRAGDIRFDETLTSCEDYELQLREIKAGRNTVRLNTLGPNTVSRQRKNGPQKGGRGFDYEDRRHLENVRTVVRRYYPIAKAARNGTSIRINERYV